MRSISSGDKNASSNNIDRFKTYKVGMTRRVCTVRGCNDRDLEITNSVWDFFGETGYGIDEWRVIFTSKCQHSYECLYESEDDDVVDRPFQNFFQCTKCRQKMSVRITFGCPICKGRHLQFHGYMYDYYCPQKPTIPFRKRDVRGAQFEVLFYE